MDSGAVPAALVSMSAPMRAKGSVTRRMGRRDREASPTNVLANG